MPQFNPKNLDILRRTTRADFYKELGVREQETLFTAIAMDLDSDSDQEVAAFFGAIPKPERTDRGGGGISPRRQLEDYALTIVNATWKMNVPVHRDTMEDAKLDQIRVRAQSQAESAMSFLDEQMTTVIEANANSYDGIAFFGANHDGGTGATHDNDITTAIVAAAAPTVAEFETAFGDNMETHRLMEDDQNRKTNHGDLALVCMIPANYETVARSVLEIGAVAGQTGNTSVWKAKAKVMINPFMSDNDRFYTWITSKSVKGMIFQKREEWGFKLLTEGDEWELNDMAHMITRGRWQFSGADHKKAVRHILTTA